MTDTSTPSSATSDAEPIDVDFEPAAPERKALLRQPPGWLALGVATLMAAGLGGVIGILASGNPTAGQPTTAAEISSELNALKAAQSQSSVKLEKAIRDASEMERRLSAAISNAASGSGSEELARLVAELETVSTRLDEAMAAANDPEMIASLEARLSALELAGTGDEATPEDVQRTLAALGERIATLETVNTESAAELQSRDDTIRTLKDEVDTLRQELTNSQTASAGDTDALAELLASREQSDTEARRDLEAARSSTDAALALSGIEAAARQGRGFAVDHAKLSAALPDNPNVRVLGTLAESGAPTLATLQKRFSAAHEATLANGDSDETETLGWLNRMFGDAVNIRRSGTESSEIMAALDEAAAAVERGDLESAVALIASLEDPPTDALSDWTRQANARMTLEAALETLRLDLIGAER